MSGMSGTSCMSSSHRRRLGGALAVAYGVVVVIASAVSLLEARAQGEGYIPLLLLIDLPLMALVPSGLHAIAWPLVPTLCGLAQAAALWRLITGRRTPP